MILGKPPTVLWFPQVRYLSLQPFEYMVNSWAYNHRHILLDTSSYSGKFRPINLEEKKNLLTVYDEVYVLEPRQKSYSQQKHLNELLKYNELKKRVRKILKKENIELAIFPTDIIFEFRLLRRLQPKIKLAVIQVSFRRIEQFRSYGWVHQFIAFFYDKILGVPLFRSRYYFGEQDRHAWYLFWTQKWAKSVPRLEKTQLRFSNATLATSAKKPDLNLDQDIKQKIDGRPLVTVFLNKGLTIGQEAFIEYSNFYIYMVNSCPEFFFIIKVHPYEDFDYCHQLYANMNSSNSAIIASKYQPDQLLVNSDLFITHWSTAIQDAMRYKVPTILVNPKNRHSMRMRLLDDFPYIVNDKTELPKVVANTLQNTEGYWDKLTPFIEDSFGKSFEDGPKKMVKELYAILGESSQPDVDSNDSKADIFDVSSNY
jgi:hypothetical protein